MRMDANIVYVIYVCITVCGCVRERGVCVHFWNVKEYPRKLNLGRICSLVIVLLLGFHPLRYGPPKAQLAVQTSRESH